MRITVLLALLIIVLNSVCHGMISVADEGQHTAKRTSLYVQWHTEQPYQEYEYAVGISPQPPPGFTGVYPKVLTLGDSITYSPPDYWNNHQSPGWGMNASSRENDYVHRMLSRMRQANPLNAQEHFSSVGAHQAGGKITDVLALIETFKGYKADLVTLQIGENDNNLTVPQFVEKYELLLDLLMDNDPVPAMFCWGVWSAGSAYGPWTRQAQMEAGMKAACDARGIPFRSLGPVATNPASVNGGGTGFINWHPNDAGMRGYSDLFWDAMGGFTLDWQSAGSDTSVNITGLQLIDGYTYYVYVRGKDAEGNWSPVYASDGILVDSSPPSKPSIDSALYQNTPGQMTAVWLSHDTASDIVEYEYAMGTWWSGPTGYLIVPWTKTTENRATAYANFPPGQVFYWYVRAKNASGLVSPIGVSSGSKIVVAVESSPGAVKLHPDGTAVAIKDAVVTGRFTDLGGRNYIQAKDRSSGIAMSLGWSLSEGSIVTAAGTVETDENGERVLMNRSNTAVIIGSNTDLKPLGISLTSAQSADFYYDFQNNAGQRGTQGTNLSATGLLVKMTGFVVQSEAGLTLSVTPSGSVAIVRLDELTKPAWITSGDLVTVTGILSMRDGKPFLRPRRSSDWSKQ